MPRLQRFMPPDWCAAKASPSRRLASEADPEPDSSQRCLDRFRGSAQPGCSWLIPSRSHRRAPHHPGFQSPNRACTGRQTSPDCPTDSISCPASIGFKVMRQRQAGIPATPCINPKIGLSKAALLNKLTRTARPPKEGFNRKPPCGRVVAGILQYWHRSTGFPVILRPFS